MLKEKNGSTHIYKQNNTHNANPQIVLTVVIENFKYSWTDIDNNLKTKRYLKSRILKITVLVFVFIVGAEVLYFKIDYLISYPNCTIRTLTEEWQIDKCISQVSRKLLFFTISILQKQFGNSQVSSFPFITFSSIFLCVL